MGSPHSIYAHRPFSKRRKADDTEDSLAEREQQEAIAQFPYVEFTGRDSITCLTCQGTGYIPGESLVITVEDDSSRRVPGCPHDSPSPRLDFFPSSSATVIDHALSRSQLRWIDKLGQVPQLLWVSRYLKALLLFTFAPLFVVSLGWNTWFALHSAV